MQTKIQYFHNKGNGHWEERTYVLGPEGIPGGLNIMQTDYNNDGRPDIFILRGGWLGSYGKIPNTLLRNDGTGPDGRLSFTDVTRKAGMNDAYPTQTAVWVDFNNDGWLDFYCGNGDPDLRSVIPNRMFRFDGQIFREITNAGFGHIQKGHGTAFADFDGDGDQDIYMVVGGFYQGDIYQNILLENQAPVSTNYASIRLIGRKSNRFGVGSRLRLVVQDGDGWRSICRTIRSGGSFGASSFTQHIGLGKAETIDTLVIHWAGSQTRQVLTGLAVNQWHKIEESSIIQ